MVFSFSEVLSTQAQFLAQFVQACQNVFENMKKEIVCFVLELVSMFQSFNYLPSYQAPIARWLQVIDRKRNQPLVSMPYCFITVCKLLRLPYKVNWCPYFNPLC